MFLSYVMTGGGVLAGAVVGGIFSINFTSNFAEDYGWRYSNNLNYIHIANYDIYMKFKGKGYSLTIASLNRSRWVYMEYSLYM